MVTSTFQSIFDLVCAEAYSMHMRASTAIGNTSERPGSAPASLAFSDLSSEPVSFASSSSNDSDYTEEEDLTRHPKSEVSLLQYGLFWQTSRNWS